MKRPLILAILIVLLIYMPPPSARAQSPQDPEEIVLEAEYRNSEPVTITGNQDFVNQKWGGNGTFQDPFVISGLNITHDICISISDTTAWFVIQDCYLESNSSTGVTVVLNNVTRGMILNSFIGGEMIGIYMSDTLNCHIQRCRVRGLDVGILLQNALECTTRENLVHSCEVGIKLDNAVRCNIIGNSIYANSETGIVATRLTRENTFYDNFIGFNAMEPTGEHTNAIDDGSQNRWDDRIERGNSWSDTSADDGPYVVNGLSNAIDNYPAHLDNSSTTNLLGTSNLVFIVGSTGHMVVWNATDLFPVSYRISLNSRVIAQGWWESSYYLFNASILPVGVYNLTLSVYNGKGIDSLNEVYINVLEDIFGDIEAEYVLIASTLSVILVFVVLIFIKRYVR